MFKWFLDRCSTLKYSIIKRLINILKYNHSNVTEDRKMNYEFLEDKEIIVASNRGPVVFKRDETEKIELIRGAGGIVGSMIPFLKKNTWKMGFFCSRRM